MRGYIRGLRAAGEYLDMSKNTFSDFIKEHGMQVRRWRGQSYFKITDLDRLMEPVATDDPFFSPKT